MFYDRYYFQIETHGKNRFIHFFGNIYSTETGINLEEYKGAYFDMALFSFANPTAEDMEDFFYDLIDISKEITEAEAENCFSGTEIRIKDISTAADGEYYIDMMKEERED